MVWQLKQRKARELISRAPDSAPPSGHNQQAVNWFNGLIKRYRTKTKFNPKTRKNHPTCFCSGAPPNGQILSQISVSDYELLVHRRV